MPTGQNIQAKVFRFLDQEILAGEGDILLSGSDALSGVIKRYTVGGENRMHAHPTEDHTFYILDGEATFHIESDQNVVVAGKHDGVFLPKGTPYWFQSSGETKLIILRVGTEIGSDRIINGEDSAQQEDHGKCRARSAERAVILVRPASPGVESSQ